MPRTTIKEIDIDDNRLGLSEESREFANFKKLFDIEKVTELSKTIRGVETLIPGAENQEVTRKRRIVYNFIVSVQLASGWYTEQMVVDNTWRRIYNVITFVIIGALPIVLWSMMYFLEHLMTQTSAGKWTSGVTAVLASLVGLQKAWGAWLDSHKRFGARWSARATLRDIMYSLRDRWCGHAVDAAGTFAPDFLEALAVATAQARTAVRLEQQKFFDTYDSPSVDIASYITSARTSALAINSDLVQAATNSAAARSLVATKRGEVDALTALLGKLEDADPAKKDVQAKMAAAKSDLAVAEGRLAGISGAH